MNKLKRVIWAVAACVAVLGLALTIGPLAYQQVSSATTISGVGLALLTVATSLFLVNVLFEAYSELERNMRARVPIEDIRRQCEYCFSQLDKLLSKIYQPTDMAIFIQNLRADIPGAFSTMKAAVPMMPTIAKFPIQQFVKFCRPRYGYIRDDVLRALEFLNVPSVENTLLWVGGLFAILEGLESQASPAHQPPGPPLTSVVGRWLIESYEQVWDIHRIQ